MLAIDTNIVVRCLVSNDEPQTFKARKIVNERSVYVGVTVILEVAWVLERPLGFSRDGAIDAIEAFVGLPTVTVEEPAALHRAFELARLGMDIADAMHIARAEPGVTYLTFDRKFAKLAAKAGYAVELA